MARFGWVLVLLLATAGCTSGSAADDPAAPAVATSSASPPSSGPTRTTASSSSAPRSTASSAPARPSVSAGATRAVGQVPPVSAAARAVGLIDIRTVVPDAVVDLRYATSDNFVGARMYPVGARCLVHQSMAPGLKVAARRLRRQRLVVVFWDCYRPHAVQVRMFEMVPDPNWVARPGAFATSHEAGRSVDITLARAGPGVSCLATAQRVQGHCLLDMGTGFDDFTARAHAFATSGVSAVARSNRALLRSAMNAGGITGYSGEWWHFDGPGSGVRRPHLNVPLD